MRNVNVLKVYNLVDSKGNKLRLRLGELRSRDDICVSSADKGYRWSFIGDNIPMPVRSLTWFNGFPEATMLDWLKGNGWYPQTCVDLNSGYAKVYDLPKGNEISDHIVVGGENALNRAIKLLCDGGSVLTAVQLYRYVNHPCSIADAKHAVDVIRFDN